MRDINLQVYLKISEVPRSEYPPMDSHSDCAAEEVKKQVPPTPMVFFALAIPPLLAKRTS